jgi:hypothetical protein
MVKVLIMLFSLLLRLLRHSGRRDGSLPRVGLGRSEGMASGRALRCSLAA